MSWSRRLILIGGASLVAGCFRPMLAEDGAAMGLQGKIELPAVDDRFSYELHDALEARLGRPDLPIYRLDIRSQVQERGLAIAQDNSVTRISLIAIADWELYRSGVAEPLLKDRTVSQSGYNATSSLYATRAAKQDIERRLARDLGERVARSVLARADRLAAAQ